MVSARAEFTFQPTSVGEARRFLRHELDAWDANDLEPAASLVLSELTTNSLIHARSSFVVELTLTDQQLRLAVRDSSTRLPVAKPHSPDAATGRGLRIVAAFADAWGTEASSDGKTVWAVLSVGHDCHLVGRATTPTNRLTRSGEPATPTCGQHHWRPV